MLSVAERSEVIAPGQRPDVLVLRSLGNMPRPQDAWQQTDGTWCIPCSPAETVTWELRSGKYVQTSGPPGAKHPNGRTARL